MWNTIKIWDKFSVFLRKIFLTLNHSNELIFVNVYPVIIMNYFNPSLNFPLLISLIISTFYIWSPIRNLSLFLIFIVFIFFYKLIKYLKEKLRMSLWKFISNSPINFFNTVFCFFLITLMNFNIKRWLLKNFEIISL